MKASNISRLLQTSPGGLQSDCREWEIRNREKTGGKKRTFFFLFLFVRFLASYFPRPVILWLWYHGQHLALGLSAEKRARNGGLSMQGLIYGQRKCKKSNRRKLNNENVSFLIKISNSWQSIIIGKRQGLAYWLKKLTRKRSGLFTYKRVRDWGYVRKFLFLALQTCKTNLHLTIERNAKNDGKYNNGDNTFRVVIILYHSNSPFGPILPAGPLGPERKIP